MLSRIHRTVAAGAVVLLVVVGGVVLAAVSPAALVAALAAGSIVGLITATHLPATAFPSSTRRHRGVAAGLLTVAALLATAGIAALLGAAAAPVLLLLLLGAGAALWRHRAAWRARAAAHGVPLPGDPAAGAAQVVAPQALGPLTVRALCLAWQRSQWSLHSLPAGVARSELISTRQRLLDELEQRDPVGFRRWLHRGAHASSDPAHYLTDNRTARTPRRNDSSAP